MKNYADIIKNISKRSKRGSFDDIVLVDGMNMLIRSFVVLKTLKRDGTHIGGITGFLRSLNYIVRITDPTRLIIIWDGKGGSMHRKNLNSDYKAQRGHTRITNWGMYETKEDETKALSAQLGRVQNYLECLPIQSVMMDKLEADDIIAYLARTGSKSGKNVTIVSTDKDFGQLLSPNIRIYEPVRKKFITYENLKKEIGILPENLNIVKSLISDTSDNIKGIRGAGIPTLRKLFPKLSEEKVTLDYIYQVAEEGLEDKKPKKIFSNIIMEWDNVEINYKVVDLHNTLLDDKETTVLYNTIKAEVPPLRVGPFLRLLDQDDIDGITKHTEGWLQAFSRLQVYK